MQKLIVLLFVAATLAGCNDPFGQTEREQIRADSAVQIAQQDRIAREAEAAATSDSAYYWAHGLSRSVFWLASGLAAIVLMACVFGLSRDVAEMNHHRDMRLIDYDQERWRIEQRDRQYMQMAEAYLDAVPFDQLPIATPEKFAIMRGAWRAVPDESGETLGFTVIGNEVQAYRLLTG